jgi:hypothetical protein
LPYPQLLQEFHTARADGIDSAVPAIVPRKRRWRTRFYQRHLEASLLEAKREACSNQPPANDNDIEFHKAIIQAWVSFLLLKINRKNSKLSCRIYEE